jgi:double-stranded uracil-DNA glycosylase
VPDPASAARRPSPEDLAAAVGTTIPDVIGPRLRVLFCGVNPGLWSGAAGHHFARPGNRFWRALAASGFTTAVVSPFDDHTLLHVGLGITNIFPAATRSAAEVTQSELRQGVLDLKRKVRTWRPRAVAVLGLEAYRKGFERADATIGRQHAGLAGAQVWVIPNPSGIQAYYPFDRLVAELRALREATEPRPSESS